MPNLGLSSSLPKGGVIKTYVKDGLKLYMPYKSSKEVKFVGTGSASFDGTDDYINVGDVDLGTSDFTISLWAKATEWTSRYLMYKKEGSGLSSKYWYFGSTGAENMIFASSMEGTTTISYEGGGGELTPYENQWVHLSIVGDRDANIKGYINGVLQDTDTGSNFGDTLDNTSDLEISGVNTASTGGGFTGSIKNAAIWERALSDTEVQNVMHKTYPELSGTLLQGLVSWWALDATNLGSNILTNGDLSSETGWTLGTGFTMDTTAQTVGVNNSNGDWENLINDQTLVSGLTYQVSTTISDYTSGTLRLSFQGGATAILDTFSGVGTNTQSFTCTNSSQKLYLQSSDAGTDTICTISAISVKEVQIEDLEGSNEGSIFGAIIDTDLYGGDTPVIPRGFDNAPVVQADAIGTGYAVFDNSSYIEIGNVANLNFMTGSFTISAWVKTSSSSANDGIVCKNSQWQLLMDTSNKLQFALYDGTLNPYVVSDATINDGAWHYLTGVRHTSDDNLYIYIDGVVAGTQGGPPADGTAGDISSSDTVDIGRRADDEFFNGNIKNVGIWAGALTQSQIQSVMEKTYADLLTSEKSDLGSELFTDGDMEIDDEGDEWKDSTGGEATISKDTSNPYAGSRSLKALREGGNGGFSQAVTTVVGTTYKYTGYVYISASSWSPAWDDAANMGVGGVSLGTELDTTGEWISFTHYFAATAETMYVGGWKGEDGSYVLVDNLSLKAVTIDLISWWGLDTVEGDTVGDLTAGGYHVSDEHNTTLGSEVIVDGDFSSSSGWTLEGSSEPSIDTSAGTCTFTDNDSYIEQSTLSTGVTYKIVITVNSWGGGKFLIRSGGTTYFSTPSGAASAGDYTYYITATNTVVRIEVAELSGNTIVISNVSYKIVNGNYGELK